MLRDEAPAFLQSPRPGDALNRENQPGPVSPDQEYMALTPVTKSGNWEITREHVQVVRMIGKGAFSQVAKALAWNISGVKGVTTVAVKMLKGMRILKILVYKWVCRDQFPGTWNG